MLADKKRNTNIGVGIGIVVQFAGNIALASQDSLVVLLGLLLWLVGTVVFVWGCMNYAEGKGHSKWFGLLGLLSIIGLLVLIFLPDRHKQTAR